MLRALWHAIVQVTILDPTCGSGTTAFVAEQWDPERRAWTGPGRFRPTDVTGWVEAGARLVGGCCRLGPADIAAMRSALRN